MEPAAKILAHPLTAVDVVAWWRGFSLGCQLLSLSHIYLPLQRIDSCYNCSFRAG